MGSAFRFLKAQGGSGSAAAGLKLTTAKVTTVTKVTWKRMVSGLGRSGVAGEAEGVESRGHRATLTGETLFVSNKMGRR